MINLPGREFNRAKSFPLPGMVLTICLLALSGCHKSFHPQGASVEEAVFEREGVILPVRETLSFKAGNSCLLESLLKNPLTAESASQIALLNNPSLKREMMGIGIKEADVEAAMLLPNPSFALGLFFPDKSALDTGLEAGLSYKIVDLFLMPHRIRAAKEAYYSEELRVLKAAIKLIGEVKEAYYALQQLQDQNELAASIREAAELKWIIARKLYVGGSIGDDVLTQAEEEVWQSREEEAEWKIALEEGRTKLTILLGVRLECILIDKGAAEKVPPCSLEEVLEAACYRVDIALLSHELKHLYSLRPLYAPLSYTFLSIGAGFEHDPEKYNAFGPLSAFDLPIFNSGQTDRRRVDYEIGALIFQREMAWIRALGELTSSFHKYKIAEEKLSYAIKRASSAKEGFSSTHRLYNVMNISPFELFDAKKAELNAYLKLSLAKGEAMQEAVRLKRAMQISLND